MQKQIIKIAGEAVGALMPFENGLRFLAVKFHVWPLDGKVFADHHAAHRALTAHLAAARRDSAPASDERLH